MRNITFDEYLMGEGRSGGQWVCEPSSLLIYVRRSIRCPNGFELANLELEEQFQQQGILTRFLARHNHLALKIENVLNSALERWLIRHIDWKPEDPDRIGLDASYVNNRWCENTRRLRS
jgi:hypothetical protein